MSALQLWWKNGWLWHKCSLLSCRWIQITIWASNRSTRHSLPSYCPLPHSSVVSRRQQMVWSLRPTPAQTACRARAWLAAGGWTPGWANLWWCLKSTLPTQPAPLLWGGVGGGVRGGGGVWTMAALLAKHVCRFLLELCVYCCFVFWFVDLDHIWMAKNEVAWIVLRTFFSRLPFFPTFWPSSEGFIC